MSLTQPQLELVQRYAANISHRSISASSAISTFTDFAREWDIVSDPEYAEYLRLKAKFENSGTNEQW